MKSVFLKTLLVINLFFIYNCKAQTNTNDYINFYNDLASKLNSISLNKSQYYSQNFSNFYNKLQNENVNIKGINYDIQITQSLKYNIVYLYFNDASFWKVVNSNSFRYPWIAITFEDNLSSQIENMIEQHHSQWNNDFFQFLSNKKIEKIEFLGINGYDSNDYSAK